ncbi:MAG: ribosomal-processing cysteine protease Prp [Clostridia bacterium]|nr:ribosomal-processing cysteine protease Prp [Clostridia bacterium]
MNTLTFFKQNGKLFGFSSVGHAGRGTKGNDVVCAAISEAVRYTANMLDAFAHQVNVSVNEENATVCVTVKNPDINSETVLKTFLSEARLIKEEYPKNITIHITEV